MAAPTTATTRPAREGPLSAGRPRPWPASGLLGRLPALALAVAGLAGGCAPPGRGAAGGPDSLCALTVVASVLALVTAGAALAAVALVLFLAGTGAFVGALGLTLREVWRSPRSLTYKEVAVARPTGPVRGLRTALPALALALGLLVPDRSAAQGLPTPAPIPVAAAYTAAWNAHDLPAVLALFAPDAVVRERRAAVPAAVWDSRNPQVLRAYLDGSHGDIHDPQVLTWALGRQEIAAWAAARFALRHRYVAGPYRATEDTVSWPYQAFVDPGQLIPGVGPLEGDAEVVVHGERITMLTLVVSPESVQRRQDELAVAGPRAVATYVASLPVAGPSVPLRGPRGAAAEPASVGWPLALGGLALLAAGAGARRRRRRSGGAERNRTAPDAPTQP